MSYFFFVNKNDIDTDTGVKSKEVFFSKWHQFPVSKRNSGLGVRRLGSKSGSIAESQDCIFPTSPASCEEGMDIGVKGRLGF